MVEDTARTIADGLAALDARDAQRAAALLREVVLAGPPPDFPWLALANAELVLGQSDAAEAAVDHLLVLRNRDVGALLTKAMLRVRAGDDRSASSFFEAAEAQIVFEGGLAPEFTQMRAFGQTFVNRTRQGFTDYLLGALDGELSPTMREAIELLTGKRDLYLQQPSVFYYPGLPQRRFYEPDEFAWLDAVLMHLPAMQDELSAVLATGEIGFDPYVQHNPDRPAPANHLLGKTDWSAFHFWRDGAVVRANAERCPATMAALEAAPLPRIPGRSPNAHWSSLLPGTHIKPHTGMLNTRLICHVPIQTAPDCWLRVGSEVRTWRPGIPLIFDDSIEHEARNQGPERRVVLLFEIWRPEINEEDRAAISRIFEAIGSYGLG